MAAFEDRHADFMLNKASLNETVEGIWPFSSQEVRV